MNDKILEFIRAVGVPSAMTLILAGLLYLQNKSAAEERVSHAALMIDQVSDLREKVQTLEVVCRRAP